MRYSKKTRNTKETKIIASLNLDEAQKKDNEIKTGIGFFDHMLTLFSFHSGFSLMVDAKGDTDVDDHHTVEDVGIILGEMIREALGDKKGIKRYGTFYVPMDEALARVSLDISGREFLVFNCEFSRESIGDYSTEMTEEFFRALANNGGITLHIEVLYGKNDHHKAEAIFKAFGRAMKEAVSIVGDDVPSSKGVLS